MLAFSKLSTKIYQMNWPWTRELQKVDKGVSTEHLQAALAALRAELESQIKELDRVVATVDTEWSDWFDKFRRLYARLAKREQRAAELEQSAENPPEDTNGDRAGVLAPPIKGKRSLRRW